MDKEPITISGLQKLKEELIFLKEKKRPEIVAAIAEARSHGDLKENAEYHAAKEQQSHNEGRIQEIEDLIARANVIDVTTMNNDGKVIFGSTVYLQNLDTNEKIEYKLVAKDEADLKKKLIFFQSPIGKGLIGKNKNDLVEISTPAGIKNFEIKAKTLIENYNYKEGKELGNKLKEIEEFWIDNSFKISKEELNKIVKN